MRNKTKPDRDFLVILSQELVKNAQIASEDAKIKTNNREADLFNMTVQGATALTLAGIANAIASTVNRLDKQ